VYPLDRRPSGPFRSSGHRYIHVGCVTRHQTGARVGLNSLLGSWRRNQDTGLGDAILEYARGQLKPGLRLFLLGPGLVSACPVDRYSHGGKMETMIYESSGLCFLLHTVVGYVPWEQGKSVSWSCVSPMTRQQSCTVGGLVMPSKVYRYPLALRCRC
jgi:hypothetical protein